MPEAIVFAVADAALSADLIGEAGIAFVEGTTLGVGNATLIGSGLILATTIGLQYALSRPSAPRAEDGSQPIMAPIQPRQRGYWDNRLSGAVMLATTGGAAPTTAVMVAAFHQGPVDSIQRIYFDDDQVRGTADVTNGGYIGSIIGPGGAYASAALTINMGRPGQVADPILTGSVAGGTWTADFVGNDIAYWGLQATAPADPTAFATLYPRGLPKPSLVARCSPVWDPRDGTQERDNPSTWKASPNPVLQLIDYLRARDGGMGFDIDEFLPFERLEQWMAEADLCDIDLGGGDIRFRSAFWYTYDTSPQDIIGKNLATCDGWLAPAGDGTLKLTVGVFRAPSLPPITEKDVYDCAVDLGNPDETLINQLDCAWTNADEDYSSDQEPIQDSASVSLVGEIKRSPLDLSAVQWLPQVVRLGSAGLRRINPKRQGTLIGKDICLRYQGERWIALQYPLPGLEDCVIEVQDFQADILGGTVTIKFIRYDPVIASTLLEMDFSKTVDSLYLVLLEDI